LVSVIDHKSGPLLAEFPAAVATTFHVKCHKHSEYLQEVHHLDDVTAFAYVPGRQMREVLEEHAPLQGAQHDRHVAHLILLRSAGVSFNTKQARLEQALKKADPQRRSTVFEGIQANSDAQMFKYLVGSRDQSYRFTVARARGGEVHGWIWSRAFSLFVTSLPLRQKLLERRVIRVPIRVIGVDAATRHISLLSGAGRPQTARGGGCQLPFPVGVPTVAGRRRASSNCAVGLRAAVRLARATPGAFRPRRRGAHVCRTAPPSPPPARRLLRLKRRTKSRHVCTRPRPPRARPRAPALQPSRSRQMVAAVGAATRPVPSRASAAVPLAFRLAAAAAPPARNAPPPRRVSAPPAALSVCSTPTAAPRRPKSATPPWKPPNLRLAAGRPWPPLGREGLFAHGLAKVLPPSAQATVVLLAGWSWRTVSRPRFARSPGSPAEVIGSHRSEWHIRGLYAGRCGAARPPIRQFHGSVIEWSDQPPSNLRSPQSAEAPVQKNAHETDASTASAKPPSAPVVRTADFGTGRGKASDVDIIRNLARYLWPKDDPGAKARVCVALGLLFAGKVRSVRTGTSPPRQARLTHICHPRGCTGNYQILNVQVPFLFKHVVDFLNDHPGAEISFVSFAGVLLLGCTVGQKAIRRVAMNVFNHLHQLDLSFHLNKETGSLTRAIDRGTKGISFLLSSIVFHVLPTAFEITMVCSILGYKYGGPFAGVTAITMCTYTAFTVSVTSWRSCQQTSLLCALIYLQQL
ncbi:MAG: hypothetical protein BJ554DRAFT_7419, partial [Olpidium bornovanus]